MKRFMRLLLIAAFSAPLLQASCVQDFLVAQVRPLLQAPVQQLLAIRPGGAAGGICGNAMIAPSANHTSYVGDSIRRALGCE